MGTTSPPRTDPGPPLAPEAAENPLTEGLERRPVDPTTLVVFGATGDLARRKLLPAVYNLAHDGSLPGHFNLLGVARADMTDDGFREMAARGIRRHSRRAPDEAVLQRLLERLHYLPGDFDDDGAYERLGDRLTTCDRAAGVPLNRCFYLATAPEFFAIIVRRLGDHGLDHHASAAVRVVIEKPFGRDLDDARRLNRAVLSVFAESQVFRIDHYLGKETVQNLLALRFANELFEPIWNRNHISQVQITAAEDIGIEGRASYYDATGALRDLVQNHLLQLLCHVAMEPPIEFTADEVRDEKAKVLRAIEPPAPDDVPRVAVRAQYGPGTVGGEPVPGYLEEEGVPPDSTTETYAALRLEVRQLALGRGAVLPAHRQAARPQAHRDRRDAQARAAPGVRGRGIERRTPEPARARHPARRGRRAVARREGARHPHAAPRGAHGFPVRNHVRCRSPRRRTSGSSWTSCAATRRCSPVATRSRLSGASAIRSCGCGIAHPGRFPAIRPGRKAPPRPPRSCVRATRGAGSEAAVPEPCDMVWSSDSTTPAQVAAVLRAMLIERHGVHAGCVPARTLNLVCVVDRPSRAVLLERLRSLGPGHASRTIVCSVVAGRADIGAVARIGSDMHPRPGEFAVLRETVVLDVGERHLPHLESIVDPLVVADVPTVVWSPRELDEAVRALVGAAAGRAAGLHRRPSPGAGACAARGGWLEHARVVDLAWLRTAPWRERLAADLRARHRRGRTWTGIRVVAVRHHAGSAVAALLLVGWLAAQLGWRLRPLQTRGRRREGVAVARPGRCAHRARAGGGPARAGARRDDARDGIRPRARARPRARRPARAPAPRNGRDPVVDTDRRVSRRGRDPRRRAARGPAPRRRLRQGLGGREHAPATERG